MKKILVVFAIFAALIFIGSCGGDGSKKLVEGGESERKAGELGGECYGNGTCNEGLNCDEENNICVEDPENPSGQTDDNADTSSEQNDDNPDSGEPSEDSDAPQTPCNPNPCKEVANSTGSCAVVDDDYACGCLEHYSWTGSVCKADSRVADCTGLPANAKWNTAESISQTWDGEEWYPSETGTYNTNPSSSECRFKCDSDYDWNGSQCWQPVDPCDPNPCLNVANSTKECIETGDTTYACKCNSGYNWIGNQCQSNSTPSLPECSSTSSTPCKDSSSGLTWSARASSTMTWSNAKSYCESYTEGGLSGWHLPTIDELKTLLIADRVTSNCQVGETNGCLSYSSCWSCLTCTQTGTQSSSVTFNCDSLGTSYSDGRYSKFGETGWFWSSSILSEDSHSVWLVDFGYGVVNYGIVTNSSLDDKLNVRCVR